MKIGTNVIITYLADSKGKIITKPVKILGDIYYGIEFENPIYNELFYPRYVCEKYLEVI